MLLAQPSSLPHLCMIDDLEAPFAAGDADPEWLKRLTPREARSVELRPWSLLCRTMESTDQRYTDIFSALLASLYTEKLLVAERHCQAVARNFDIVAPKLQRYSASKAGILACFVGLQGPCGERFRRRHATGAAGSGC